MASNNFDPDAFISGVDQSSSQGFDPDAFLASSTPQGGGSPPLGYVASKVSAMAPWNQVSKIFPEAAGKLAETYGAHGMNPYISAMLTTPLAMAPAIAGTALGQEGIYESENPIAKGLLNSPKELSPEYDKLLSNPNLNISQRTPELGGAKATFPNPYGNPLSTKPPQAIQTETAYPTNLRGAEPLPTTVPLKYPGQADNPRAFINFANARIQAFGDKLLPQEVIDYGKIISQYYKDGVFPEGSPLATDGAKLSSTVDALKNQLIQGKKALDIAYGISKAQQAIQHFLLKAPLYLGEGASGLWGAKKGYDYITRKNQ